MRLRVAAGFTLVELLLAMAITAVVLASVFGLVAPARHTFATQPEAADAQQRVRVGVDRVMKDLMMAGTGLALGDGSALTRIAPVLPYRVGEVGSDAAVGRYFRPDAISLVHATSPHGLAPSVRHTYYLKSRNDVAQLMHYDGRQSEFPVIDDVVRLTFDYIGEPHAPELIPPDLAQGEKNPHASYGPRPQPLGEDDPADSWGPGENCAWEVVDGAHRSKLLSLSDARRPVALDPAILIDGPWCPDAMHADKFDVDLLRIRLIRVLLHVQAHEAFRGPQGALFMRGGTASPARYVPDQVIRFDVAPRNMNPVR